MYLVHVKHVITKIHQHGTKKTLKLSGEGCDNTNLRSIPSILERRVQRLVTGVIYKNTNKHYEDTLRDYKRDEPIAHQDLTLMKYLIHYVMNSVKRVNM